MNILVTGGAGFIGSNIADALINLGHDVTIIDNLSTGKKENINPKANFFQINILDKTSLEGVFQSQKPEVVFHVAGQVNLVWSLTNIARDLELNTKGSINVFELSVKYNVRRIIYSSTIAVYGDVDILPVNENTPIKPLSPYGISKYSAEQYLEYFKKRNHIERVVLRYSNVYGPRQNPLGEAGVVSIFTEKIIKNEKLVVFGDGNQTRDYVYVEDVVKANLLSIDGPEGVYNIGTGIETSVNDLIRIFESVTNTKITPIYKEPRLGEVRRIYLDISKAKKELGFEPTFDIKEGIRKTIEWYKKNSI